LRSALWSLEGADGLVIVTEWQEFRHPDFEVMRRLLREPIIFDGRNLYDPKMMQTQDSSTTALGDRRALRPAPMLPKLVFNVLARMKNA